MKLNFEMLYGLLSIIFILAGIGLQKYLKKTGLGDMQRILGTTVYWLKLQSYFMIIMGSLALISFLVGFIISL
jgi:hypothetical protein